MEPHRLCLLFLVITVVKSAVSEDENTFFETSPRDRKCSFGNHLNEVILCLDDHTYIRIDYAVSEWDNHTVIAQSRYSSYNFSSIPKELRMYSPFPYDATQTSNVSVLCSPNNRIGFFCEKCKHNHGPSAHSTECHKCDYSIPFAVCLYLTIKLLPVTLLFIIIMTFRVSITSGPMLGYICFCQAHIIASRELAQIYETALFQMKNYKIIAKISFYISSIWNMDFLESTNLVKPFCISPQLRDIDVLLLNFVSVIFSLLLLVASYTLIELHARDCKVLTFCWKPFHIRLTKLRRFWRVSDSIIHAFASLLLLSFTTLNYNAYAMLNSIKVYDINTSDVVKSSALFTFPSISLYSPKYISYMTVAVVFLIAFGIIPSLLLLLYPISVFRARLQSCCSERVFLRINIFVETFQGPFKDGCDGTRDCRKIPGLVACSVLVITIIGFSSEGITFENYVLPGFCVLEMLVSVLCAYIRPCKQSSANLSLVFHSVLLAMFSGLALLWRQDLTIDTAALAGLFGCIIPIPHCVMFCWACYKLNKKFQLTHKCVVCFRVLLGRKGIVFDDNTALLPDRLINSQEY